MGGVGDRSAVLTTVAFFPGDDLQQQQQQQHGRFNIVRFFLVWRKTRPRRRLQQQNPIMRAKSQTGALFGLYLSLSLSLDQQRSLLLLLPPSALPAGSQDHQHRLPPTLPKHHCLAGLVGLCSYGGWLGDKLFLLGAAPQEADPLSLSSGKTK